MKSRALDSEGKPIGKESLNPITDTRLYEVEFVDGTIETVPANVIAENLLSQVDQEGHRQLLLDKIISHRRLESTIPKLEGTFISSSGATRKKQTTRGWELCVQWKDGLTNWVSLKDFKNSLPVELADYVITNNLQDERAFAWWVPYVVRKWKSILQKVKSKYWQRTHKYGVKIPKSVEEAHHIDKENNLFSICKNQWSNHHGSLVMAEMCFWINTVMQKNSCRMNACVLNC